MMKQHRCCRHISRESSDAGWKSRLKRWWHVRQAIEQRACLETPFIQRNCTMTGLRIPCTVAHRRCRCSSRCARSPGPPEVEAGTVLSGMAPGGSPGRGWRRGWQETRERYRGVPACPPPRRSAWRISPAADRPSPAACARLSRCGCRLVPGCSTASSSWRDRFTAIKKKKKKKT